MRRGRRAAGPRPAAERVVLGARRLDVARDCGGAAAGGAWLLVLVGCCAYNLGVFYELLLEWERRALGVFVIFHRLLVAYRTLATIFHGSVFGRVSRISAATRAERTLPDAKYRIARRSTQLRLPRYSKKRPAPNKSSG